MIRKLFFIYTAGSKALMNSPIHQETMLHTNSKDMTEELCSTVLPPHRLKIDNRNFRFSTQKHGYEAKEKNIPFQINFSFFNKTIDIVTVYMLERFLEREFREKLNILNPKFEQDFFESMQNIIIYINLKLIKTNDIAIEYGEIQKVNKTIMKDGVFVYDVEKYPISCKRFKKSLINNRERTNSKLKRILASRVYFE